MAIATGDLGPLPYLVGELVNLCSHTSIGHVVYHHPWRAVPMGRCVDFHPVQSSALAKLS